MPRLKHCIKYCLFLLFFFIFHTCHAAIGLRRSRMYWVKGEGSSSYLSKGTLSNAIGSVLVHTNFTTGCESLGCCNETIIQCGLNINVENNYVHGEIA